MSNTELAARVERCAQLIRLANGVLEPEVLDRIAAELRSQPDISRELAHELGPAKDDPQA